MVIGKIIQLEVKIWLEIDLMGYVIAYKKARLIGCDSTIILRIPDGIIAYCFSLMLFFLPFKALK